MSKTKPMMVMYVGLPASGKSTYARQLAKKINATIFSSDELREEMFGDVNDQEHNHELFIELHKRIKDCLRSGDNAIYDACNISSKRRRAFLQELNKINCVKKCIIMAKPYVWCILSDASRDRKVSPDVITRMYEHWNTPYWFEGWDDIEIVYSEECVKKNPYKWMLDVSNYDQQNSHHTMSLGEHCYKTAKYLLDRRFKNESALIIAACMHDCGKLYTGKFENAKGEPTEERHYYKHENVGAYEALFFDCQKADPLDVSILVNLHMRPYNCEHQNEETELKLYDKYRKLWGDDLFKCVKILHEADKAAH